MNNLDAARTKTDISNPNTSLWNAQRSVCATS